MYTPHLKTLQGLLITLEVKAKVFTMVYKASALSSGFSSDIIFCDIPWNQSSSPPHSRMEWDRECSRLAKTRMGEKARMDIMNAMGPGAVGRVSVVQSKKAKGQVE